MKRVGVVLTAMGLALGAATAAAQDRYPSKPVKIVVPYAPGGATDITSRLFGEQLRQILGQQFVVESKPGAFGILAIEEMARSKPDGYTVMVGNVSTNAITPVLFQKKFSINFEKDVVSVSRMVHEALAVADEVAGDGISVEVIDLRTVAPLDLAPVLESVHKTSRLMIAHEAVLPFGIGAEIAATVAREGFWDLDAPIERIGAAPTPPPYAPDLERARLPDRDDITDAIRRLARV